MFQVLESAASDCDFVVLDWDSVVSNWYSDCESVVSDCDSVVLYWDYVVSVGDSINSGWILLF